jgi:adenylyltransferase/sulfurtransferase
MLPAITPAELNDELKSPNPPTVIDVREPHELAISALDGTINIPLGQLPAHLTSLDKNADLVIMCRVGGRSAQATSYMIKQGFLHVRNLTDGINGWARAVDRTMKEY